MVSKKEDRIDFSKLEDELNKAVELDARYWRENDAKFRAVDQKVGSYEEFRDIVLASHLKPLYKEDKITPEQFKQKWNSSVSSHTANYRNISASTAPASSELKNASVSAPRTSLEFVKRWRTADSSQRCSMLLAITPSSINKLFQYELDSTLLVQIILVMLENCSTEEHVKSFVERLEAMGSVQRFSLSLSMMSKSDRETCRKLFVKMRRVLEGEQQQQQQQQRQQQDNRNKGQDCESELLDKLKDLERKYCDE